jgi:hypothetical protein
LIPQLQEPASTHGLLRFRASALLVT